MIKVVLFSSTSINQLLWDSCSLMISFHTYSLTLLFKRHPASKKDIKSLNCSSSLFCQIFSGCEHECSAFVFSRVLTYFRNSREFRYHRDHAFKTSLLPPDWIEFVGEYKYSNDPNHSWQICQMESSGVSRLSFEIREMGTMIKCTLYLKRI